MMVAILWLAGKERIRVSLKVVDASDKLVEVLKILKLTVG
jgi:hypothetical protein